MSPRVTPKRSRFRDDEVCRAWQSFAYQGADGVEFTIPRGTRLKATHDAVRLHPWNFVSDLVGDDEEPSPYSFRQEPSGPKFSKPTRLRFKWRTLRGIRTYEPGDEEEFPPDVAQQLVEMNCAEPV